ncbi:S8 family serine peptidase [Austwickia chelonae]|uniref:Putative peptidase n=1 Tax=Austwickia chelonae NBRC 105200 TaxID=1184607 RepID=K6VKS0_9MICO|nr:S8 family serine peptidase [Austwickia chelonae]GAB77344.1 putative peptidase [Austwickia chelonae NBRC 105200]
MDDEATGESDESAKPAPGDSAVAISRRQAERTASAPKYTGRVVLKLTGPPASAAEESSRLLAAATEAGAQIDLARHTATGAMVVEVVGDAVAVARTLAARPGVEYAVPERRFTTAEVPNDPYYPAQWDLPAIRVPEAWKISDGSGTTVAVVDTGSLPHPDIQGRFLPGYDFISDATYSLDGNGRDADPTDSGDWSSSGMCDDPTPTSSSWHGLHVAGTIAALTGNGLGVAGIAPGSRIVPIRALGRCGGTDSDVADAVVWAAGGPVPGVPANAHPAKIINLSLGGIGTCSPIEQSAIDMASARGALVIVAAGNDASDVSQYSPANCRGVITVAASTQNRTGAAFSNTGNAVTLSAPGTSIWGLGNTSTRSADPAGWTYTSRYGTSMATPHVSAIASLMWSVSPSSTPAQIRSALVSSVTPFVSGGSGFGVGIVDAWRAVDAVRPQQTAPPTVSSVNPAGARTVGGDVITVNGTGLIGGRVAVGGRSATVLSSSESSLTFQAPPGPLGRTTMVITTPGGAVTTAFFYDTRQIIARPGIPLFPQR